DSDASEIGRNRAVDIGIVGDSRSVLEQLTRAISRLGRTGPWLQGLREREAEKAARQAAFERSDQVPIHHFRLAKELDVVARASGCPWWWWSETTRPGDRSVSPRSSSSGRKRARPPSSPPPGTTKWWKRSAVMASTSPTPAGSAQPWNARSRPEPSPASTWSSIRTRRRRVEHKAMPSENAASALALNRAEALLLVIDVQERLATAMPPGALAALEKNAAVLIRAARRMEIPVVATVQYPKGLGPTVAPLRDLLPAEPMTKMEFSCGASKPIAREI